MVKMFDIDWRSEDWKHIDLSFRQHFLPWQLDAQADDCAQLTAGALVFVDGQLVGIGEALSAQCKVRTMVQEGFIRWTHIVCLADVKIDMVYVHTLRTQQHAIHYYNHLEILPRVKVSYQTHYQGEQHFVQIYDAVECHESSQLDYLLASHDKPQILKVIHQLHLKLEQHALVQIFLGLTHFALHSFTLQGELQGSQTRLHLQGIAYLAQDVCNHRIFKVHHQCSQSTSTLQLFACTTDQAHFSARASSYNAPGLQMIAIQQKFKGIVLSDRSTVSFVPSLRIKAGDVQATHSVAVYTLHKQWLWYLQTRGLSSQHITLTLMMNTFTKAFFSFQDIDAETSTIQRLLRLL